MIFYLAFLTLLDSLDLNVSFIIILESSGGYSTFGYLFECMIASEFLYDSQHVEEFILGL